MGRGAVGKAYWTPRENTDARSERGHTRTSISTTIEISAEAVDRLWPPTLVERDPRMRSAFTESRHYALAVFRIFSVHPLKGGTSCSKLLILLERVKGIEPSS